MKNLLKYFAFTFILFASNAAIGQKMLSEATISYDIVINNNDSKATAVNMLDGAMSIVYLKGKSVRTEMISSLGTESTIIDGKTGNVTILKEYGEQKFLISLTPENWVTSNQKYDKVVFTYQNEFKEIAGYNCQKAVGVLPDGTTFSVYFTKELEPLNKNFQYLNKDLPGLAMQYEAQAGKQKVTYTVSSVNFNTVAAAKYDLPTSGFRVMTYAESIGARR